MKNKMKNDDGPAFPQGNDRVVLTRSIADSQGMLLRDYFAAKAMQGLIASGDWDATACSSSPSFFADWSYELADAMLEARKK